MRFRQRILGFLFKLFRAIVWTAGVIAIALVCFFYVAEQPVPRETLERLFERLYRVESSRNRSLGGAGLGLSICKNIVEAHGGTIEADASPIGGVWIKVALPLMRGIL